MPPDHSGSTWKLEPLQQIVRSDAGPELYRSIGSAPTFEIQPPGQIFPSGPVLFQLGLQFDAEVPPMLHLLLDTGRGFTPSSMLMLGLQPGHDLKAVVHLPEDLRGLRVALPPCQVSFKVIHFRVTPIAYWSALLRLAWKRFSAFNWTWGGLVRAIRRVLRADGREQQGALVQFLETCQKPPVQTMASYADWVRLYDGISDNDRAAIEECVSQWPEGPRISIVQTGGPVVKQNIKVLRTQDFPTWQFCVVVDDPKAADELERSFPADERIRVRCCAAGSTTADCWNEGRAQAEGEWILFLDQDTRLSEQALFMLVHRIREQPEPDLLYGDEDTMDSTGQRSAPLFKPDWSPDLFFSCSYLGPVLFRQEWVQSVKGPRNGFDGDETYDLIWRLLEQHPSANVAHLPFVLFHRTVPSATPDGMNRPRLAAQRSAHEHLSRKNTAIQVVANPSGTWGHRVRYPLPDSPPLVSLIVPSRNRAPLLRRCIEGLLHQTDYANLEIIAVDNRSTESDALALFKELERTPRVRVLKYDQPFNFSAINNKAAREAHGTILGFLNNDLEIRDSKWLREMVSQVSRPEIGVVGARLLFPDGSLQHGGVILGLYGRAGHLNYALPSGETGYMGRAILTQDLCAVTGACLATRRQVFDEVSGFEEALPVTFNDVDLCMRIRKKGYRILWTPYAELYHHESASRGLDDTAEKQRIAEREIGFMRARWGAEMEEDPFYSPNLSLSWPGCPPAFPPRVSKPWQT